MLMNPSINISGTGRKELVDQRRAAMDALMGAMKALQETCPHGRDYIGHAHQFDLDKAVYRQRFAVLDTLRNELQDEALAIMHSGE